ncbi:MAG: ABC transporter substrate-binding protein [Opitutaceae bacterium]
MPHRFRFPALCLAVLSGFAAFMLFWGWVMKPELPTEMPYFDPDEVAMMEEARAVAIDIDNPPVVTVEVDYSLGPEADWWPRGEPPLLAPLVEEGKLDPVIDRIGPEPIVMEGAEGAGRYGGTMNVLTNSTNGLRLMEFYYSGGGLVRWSPLGYPIVPHLAKSWEMSEDGKTYTFELRPGIRWSDGEPFTSADILYWWEEEQTDTELTPAPLDAMMVRGKLGTVEALGPYTVRFTFPHPNGIFLERLASWAGQGMVNAPAHYLRKYHPRLGNPEDRRQMRSALRVSTDNAVYTRIKEFNNPEHPRLWPWVYRTFKPNPPHGWVRNPYYPAVDAEGRQLPYIDRVMVEVKTDEMIQVAATNGELDFQPSGVGMGQYTLLVDNQEAKGFRVLHWYESARSPFVIQPNLLRRIDPEDPSTVWKREYLNKKEFRQALSLAIDRRPIIRYEYSNVPIPAQIGPGPESGDYFLPGLREAFIEYDPERAAHLLDSIGLDQRDAEGMRTFPDGTKAQFFLYAQNASQNASALYHSITEFWRDIGLRITFLNRSDRLFGTETAAESHDIGVWFGNGEFMPILEPRFFVPLNIFCLYARSYATWYLRGGLYDNPLADIPGAVEPPEDHPLRRAMELYEGVKEALTQEERAEIMLQILEIARENTWTIAVSATPPRIMTATNDLHNVPEMAVVTWDVLSPQNIGMETLYFQSRSDSEGAMEQMRREVLTVTPRPNQITEGSEIQSDNGGIPFLKFLLLGILVTFLILVAVRHPYIGRRIAIMVPTMIVISIIVFTVIQVPPGDFATTKILELEQTGASTDLQEIERLKRDFHLNDPQFVQYLRWTGLLWFTTFSGEDLGLLQGYMGRSMFNGDPVNSIVGDRLTLTIVISLFTILFTWCIALPIGIFSAVRQYSILDYVVSFIGFIGMSVPGFLLALLLMYWSSEFLGLNVSGLFSPQFASQPEWDWPKIKDLLLHIWLPVVVIGIAGTAGMIRVMRGNLLDELRKPYVTTARAKGVRPMKLLVKYPVRLALNPFISGIGGLFPALVSGEAIVAMVLSLPTVGPLLLESLFAEDIYLAGSMLMMLSLLGVMGTLVSDLLLLALDPRIRMEGGSR